MGRLHRLEAAAVRRAVLLTGYRGDEVERTIGPRYRSVELSYLREAKPLGTGELWCSFVLRCEGEKWSAPRQVPLSPGEALRIPFGLIRNATAVRPKPFETIADWGRRVLGKGTTEYLLVPALGGIYAGDQNRLSASLIFGRARLPAADPLSNATRPPRLRARRPRRAAMSLQEGRGAFDVGEQEGERARRGFRDRRGWYGRRS